MLEFTRKQESSIPTPTSTGVRALLLGLKRKPCFVQSCGAEWWPFRAVKCVSLPLYVFILGTRKQNIFFKVLKASTGFGILGCSAYTVSCVD